MEQQDFRIGNYLQDKEGRICRVESLSNEEFNEIEAPAIEGATTALPVKPIRLAKEWLLDLGFHFDKDAMIGDERGWGLDVNECGHEFTFKDGILREPEGDESCFYEFKYVHQVQNFYHSLTGEELKEYVEHCIEHAKQQPQASDEIPTPFRWLQDEKFKAPKGVCSRFDPITIPRCATWIGEYVKKYYATTRASEGKAIGVDAPAVFNRRDQEEALSEGESGVAIGVNTNSNPTHDFTVGEVEKWCFGHDQKSKYTLQVDGDTITCNTCGKEVF